MTTFKLGRIGSELKTPQDLEILRRNFHDLEKVVNNGLDGTKIPATVNVTNLGVSDHGALTGLLDDDHSQYALLAGRTGGQEIRGGLTGLSTDWLILKASAVWSSGMPYLGLYRNGDWGLEGHGAGISHVVAGGTGETYLRDNFRIRVMCPRVQFENLLLASFDGAVQMNNVRATGSPVLQLAVSLGATDDVLRIMNSVQVASIRKDGKFVGEGSLLINLSAAWPVGSVYIAVVPTNPATLLGFGIWVAFGTGKVLVGVDPNDTDFDTVEEIGGSKTSTPEAHDLEISDHSFTLTGVTGSSVKIGTGAAGAAGVNHSHSFSFSEAHIIDLKDHAAMSIVQPYIAVYMWKRTG
jgi:hypothetical protein